MHPIDKTGRNIAGLNNATVRSLERAPVRMRESGNTQAAWRMEIDSDSGSGAIVMVDSAGAEPFYRGEGAFLGWSQQQLASAYQGLFSAPDEPPFDLHQLG